MAKINGMPTSIRAGIPKLPDTPVGWKREKLKKYLFEIKRPISLEPERSYRLVTVKRSRGGVEERSCLLGREVKTPSQFLIEAGDFLISKRQIVHGACGIVPVDLAGSVVSNEYTVIGTKGGIDLTFLQYLSESMYFQQTCFHSSIGVHVEKMIFNVERWFNWHFNIPPLSEQKKIVEILVTWDKAITTFEKLIENSKAQKKALMQQLLTCQKRYPGFTDVWLTTQLFKMVNITMGSSPPSEAYNEKLIGLPLIQGNADIKNGKSAPRIYTSEITKVCKPGDVLLSVRAPVGTVAKSAHKACIGRGVASLSSKDTSSIDFFYQLLLFIEPAWKRLSQGSTFDAINGDDIKELTVNVPANNEERKLIAAILEAQDAQIANLMGQATSLKEEKDALIQQLFGGKRRVKVEVTPTESLQDKVKK